MPGHIVVRPARAADGPARAELIRLGMISYQTEAFIFFFFQEETLQWCVLAGAVLFIFCGAPVAWCAGAVPAGAALLVAAAVRLAHTHSADLRAQKLRSELVGFVAEYRGPLPTDSPPEAPVLPEPRSAPDEAAYTQVVGTASVEERWGPGEAGWLGSLAVHPKWQRRGIGRALVRACEAEGAARGLASLDTNLSELQLAARGLLVAMGWASLGWHNHGGAARALQVAHLSKGLPHA